MTAEQFVYWLQGYFELSDDTDRLSRREHIIRDHLQEVFTKKTPDRNTTPLTITEPRQIPYGGSGTWHPPNTTEIIC